MRLETNLLKGIPVRDAVFKEIKAKVQQNLAAGGRRPGLAVILVGEDPASAVYVKHKAKGCEEVGFHHETHELDAAVSEAEVLALVDQLNKDQSIDGILIQLPMPKGLDQDRILETVLPSKDVDGFHPYNLGKLVSGSPTFVPCTPKGVLRLLKHYGIPLTGRSVAIVGRSVIVGRPLSMLMSLKGEFANATVTMCHSGTKDLRQVTLEADVVVAAVGVAHLLGPDDVKPGAVVVDVGINRIDAPERKSGTRLVGDADFKSMIGHVSAVTPVPGGIGPMTIAMLLENTWEAMCRREAIEQELGDGSV